MIFVTVGTHEQQFNRLVKYMDEWANNHDEEVIIQTGYCTYTPKYAKYKKMYSFIEMQELVDKARIVISHGGPSSFIMPLKNGKIPLVVPRQQKYDEHVNNHQLDFARNVEKRMGNIIVVENVSDLDSFISEYDNKKLDEAQTSHNADFCSELEKIIEEMFKG